MELGVNIDHVATLRQQRLTVYPDPLEAALRAEDAGADLITLHLREDRRHIQDADVRAIRARLRTRMNLECAITPEMLAIACEVKPDDVCLVPENRAELTTEGGLDVLAHFEAVRHAVAVLGEAGIRVSLFIDADARQIEAAQRAGAQVIELHTGAYAAAVDTAAVDIVAADTVVADTVAASAVAASGVAADAAVASRELERIRGAIAQGLALGLRVNAGHGLHYGNVQAVAALPGLSELNIGHAIVARAVFDGWEKAVRDMKALLVAACRP